MLAYVNLMTRLTTELLDENNLEQRLMAEAKSAPCDLTLYPVDIHQTITSSTQDEIKQINGHMLLNEVHRASKAATYEQALRILDKAYKNFATDYATGLQNLLGPNICGEIFLGPLKKITYSLAKHMSNV